MIHAKIAKIKATKDGFSLRSIFEAVNQKCQVSNLIGLQRNMTFDTMFTQ
jgi:hypothetical protein